MPLMKYFIGNKDRTNILLVSMLFPYLLLCLTFGGFHNSFLNTQHCNHKQQLTIWKTIDTSHASRIEISEEGYQHDSETCQICQWLKMPSTVAQFLLFYAQYDFAFVSHPQNSNPILPPLSILDFNIRPPPFFANIPV